MATKKQQRRGRRARVFEHASHDILKDYDFHPLEDMIKTTMTLEGAERVAAAHKIAQYFYPPLKASEQHKTVEQTTTIKVKLGD